MEGTQLSADDDHLRGRLRVLETAFETYQRRASALRIRLGRIREVVESDFKLIQSRKCEHGIGNQMNPPEGLQQSYDDVINEAESLTNDYSVIQDQDAHVQAEQVFGPESEPATGSGIIRDAGDAYSDASTEWSSVEIPPMEGTIPEVDGNLNNEEDHSAIAMLAEKHTTIS